MVQSLQYILDKWNSERTDWWIDVTSKKKSLVSSEIYIASIYGI